MPILTNCTFNGNSATNNGGGMYNKTNSSPTVTNCTFSGNSADYDGGGMYNYNSSPTVTNCILWGDTLGEIYNYNESSDPNVTYCDVEGGTGQSWFGTGCIDADPCFVNADANDFRLLYDSPCIDAGDNNSVPADTADLDNDGNTAEPIPFDANGVPRVLDGDDDGSAVVDMGAYEYELPPQIHNITQNTWYYTIQEAIDDANDGDEIEVAAGTYNEAINFNGKAVQLYSSSGPLVTIIDANGITGAYHAVQCVSGEDANTILEGFTITGGNANGPSYPDRDGGGMYNVGSSPTVTNCIFKNNKANHGGGMLNVSGSPTVTGCTFQNNVASGGTIGGGGMYNHNSSPLVTNCTFSGNYGEAWGGGGMFNAAGSNPTLINCMFSDNNAVGGGGGIYNGDDTMPILTNCTFSGNLGGPLGGGGMFNATGSNPTLINCMFSDNNAVGRGGGIYNGDDTMPILTNCTFSGNSAYLGGGMFCENSSPAVTNCTFSDNIADEGGGMCNWNNSSPTVTNCTFSGNSAYFGGGMFCENSSPAVTNCTFSDNSTEVLGGGMCNVECSPKVTGCTFTGNNSADGGGMFNWEQSSPTVTNCTFSDNSAYGEGGGGMYNYNNSSPTVTNCTFSGNIADADGGGMFNYNNGSPTVTNCTFSGNIADANGGGMWNYMSSPTVTNCILWGDTAAIDGNEIALLEGSTIDVNYCDVRGGQADIYKDGSSTVTWGININADPLFVDPCNPDPNLRNFRLAPGSPCIDAANNDFVPADTADLDGDGNTAEPTPYDLDGHPRFVDGDCNDTDIVDMGAYEFNLAYYGDLDCDCDVDVDDLAVLCDEWLLKKLLWDVREDGFVNFLDWAILANGWQDTTNIDDVAVFADQWLLCGAYRADIAPAPNGEGVVNMLDFATLAENWLLGAE
jgi:parallel beta-helix repeat protein